MKKIKKLIFRSIVKIQIKNKDRRFNLLPCEQRELLKLIKSVIRHVDSEVKYSPLSTNFIVIGTNKTIVFRDEEVIIISGDSIFSLKVDRELKDSVLEYLSLITDHKVTLVAEVYKDHIKKLGRE